MKIRRTEMGDLDSVLSIYAYAREQMRLNGNPLQWGDSRPQKLKVAEDLNNGNSYVILHEGRICGVFAFILGEEPNYRKIKGKWKNDLPYGTIHRIASNGTVKGIFDICIEFCLTKTDNLRIDTHRDNKVMLHLIEKHNFERCGVIYVEDGTPRIAFQLTVA